MQHVTSFFVVCLCVATGVTERITFNNEKTPVPYYLAVKAFVYVEAERSPARTVLQNFRLHLDGGIHSDFLYYDRIHLVLVPRKEILSMRGMQGSDFSFVGCGEGGLAPVSASIKLQIVSNSSGNYEGFVNKSGAYAIVVANCGDASALHFSGDVFVYNSFGGLLGSHEVWKPTVYVVFAILIVATGVVFLLHILKMPLRQASSTDIWIGFLIVLSSADVAASLWRWHLQDSYGDDIKYALGVSDFLSILRWTFLAQFLLSLTKISRTWLETKDGCPCDKQTVLTVFFGMCIVPFVMTFRERYRYAMGPRTIALLGVPMYFAGCLVTFYVLRALAPCDDLLLTYRDRNMQLTSYLVRTNSIAVIFSFIWLLLDVPGDNSWASHVLVEDVLPQSVQFSYLLGLVLIWCSPWNETPTKRPSDCNPDDVEEAIVIGRNCEEQPIE